MQFFTVIEKAKKWRHEDAKGARCASVGVSLEAVGEHILRWARLHQSAVVRPVTEPQIGHGTDEADAEPLEVDVGPLAELEDHFVVRRAVLPPTKRAGRSASKYEVLIATADVDAT